MSTNEYEQALEQLDEVMCPRCLGSGTVPAMSDNGPDAYEVEVCCDHCDGSGTAGGAYKVLSEYRSKARAELVQLRYFKWRTEQERQKSAWQPIKTAPKDGTHILVWTGCSDTAYVVCWADAAKGIRKYLTAESGAERGWHLAWDGELFDREHEPTHWMPLPDAPAAAA